MSKSSIWRAWGPLIPLALAILMLTGVLIIRHWMPSESTGVTQPKLEAVVPGELRLQKLPAELGTVSRSVQIASTELPPLPVQRRTKVRSQAPKLESQEVESWGDKPRRGKLELNPTDVLKERGGSYGYTGENYGVVLDQGWITVLHPSEIDGVGQPVVAYQLSSVVRGNATVAEGGLAAPSSSLKTRTVSYVRGMVEERYTLRKKELEQDFIIRQLPAGKGDLIVTGMVSTNLVPPPSGTIADSLSFSHSGNELVRFSKAVAIDAEGESISLAMGYENQKLSIAVPEQWISNARFPVTIDPVISTSFVVDSAASNPGTFRGPAVSSNSTDNCWLVVWSEAFGGSNYDYNVYAQRIDRNGNLLGTQIVISNSSVGEQEVVVSYAPSPINRWLIVWDQDPIPFDGFNDTLIQACVLNGNGTVFKPIFQVGDLAGSDMTPAVAYDGTQWHVSWANTNAGNITIRGKFVTSAGVVGATADVETTGSASLFYRASSYAGGRFAFIWSDSIANQVWSRTMTSAGVLSAISTVGTGTGQYSTFATDVVAGNNQFLLLWTTGSGTQGRIADTNLNYITPSFFVGGDWARAAYSQTNGVWICSGTGTNSFQINAAGVVSALGNLVPPPPSPEAIADSAIAWNSADNVMLVTYRHYFGTLTNVRIEAVRWGFPLPAPTGLAATASDGKVQLVWNAVPGAIGYSVSRAAVSGGPYSFLGESGTPTYTDTLVLNGTTYFYVVQAIDQFGGLGLATSQVSAQPLVSGNKSILFVVGTSPIPAGTGDAIVQARMVALGYSVIVKPAGGVGAATTADATGKVLVAISGSVSPANVGTNFTNVTTPVITWHGGVLNAMGMISGNQLNVDYGTISGQTQVAVSNRSNPAVTPLASLPSPTSVMTQVESFTWSKLNNFASTGATVSGDTSKALVATFEVGDVMPGMPHAPGRRVSFFLSASSATHWNSLGQSLFDSAVQWAIGAPSQPQSVWASVGNGQITIHWETSGTATAYTVARSTSSGGPFTPIATVTSGYFVDTGRVNGVTYYYQVTASNALGQSLPSAVMSAVAQDATVVVAIQGGPYLRRRKQGNPIDHFNSRAFSAIVYRNGAPVANNKVLPVGTAAWSITAPASIGTPAQTSTTCTIVANDNPDGAQGDAQLVYSVKVEVGLNGQGQPIYETVPPVKCTVHVVPQYRVSLKFHFPNDGNAKRTQRAAYPHLFDADPDTNNTRQNERSKLAGDLIAGIQGQQNSMGHVWDQAAIDFYSGGADNNMNEKIGAGWGGQGGNEFVVNRAASAAVAALNVDHNINVYLVHSLVKPDDPTVQGLAYTRADLRIIVLSDNVVPGDHTLTHEAGHAFELRDEENPVNTLSFPSITGTINNVTPIYGAGDPTYKRYLMWGVMNSQLGKLISEAEAKRARENAWFWRQEMGVVSD